MVGAAFGRSVPGAPVWDNPYALDGGAGDVVVGAYALGQLLFASAFVASVAAVVVRFRRSRGIEREQLKWIAYVLCLLAVAGTAATFAYDDSILVRVAIAVAATAFPVSVCVAILRYRLYDIDVIITRTLVYAALTVVLAGAYAAVAVVLGTALGGARSPSATAGATLTVAAAFLPLRRRLQDVVDRRFRRARYDALARVDAFLDDLRAGRCAPEALEPLLRDLLPSPGLSLRYVLPGATLPEAPNGHTQTLVQRAGTLLAVVTQPSTNAEDGPGAAQLRAAVLERAGLAVEIGRLQAVVTDQLAEVVASRARIVAAGHEERRRLERDLHDGAQQRLVSVGLALRHAQHQLGESPVTATIEQAVEQVGAAIVDLRELANGVRPAQLDGGLDVALRELARRSPLPVELRMDGRPGAGRYPADVEATAYFVACEALTNAVKHAAATTVRLHAREDDGALVLTVQDDGAGGAQIERGSGLRGLVDRVSAQGGQLLLDSALGTGTTVVARLPCAS
jgi:signal transduction histidine kinase